MDAPFLDFSFYVGTAGVRPAVEALVPNVPTGALPEELYVPNLIGLIKKPEMLKTRERSIVLRTEGDIFCVSEQETTPRVRRLGRRVYERFVDIADRISCIYGAILIEYPLEEPDKLRKRSRSLAFRDFFLSEASIDAQTIQRVVALAGDGAFVERRKHGVYISMTMDFNPRHRHIERLESQKRSDRIAVVLGGALP
ncbi:hypothetical protein [Chondromyces crocatus]|uniref:hypothetical protein n=1 Tax=Chondromyces crocatus TaxID=52 RepID=UPI0012E2C21E|nr:hypothetical protein [Chondromyces crocatus]